MDEGTGSREFDLAAVLERVKRDPNGPEQRASKLYKTLASSGATNYDALCFSVEYIASMVVTAPWLETAARELVRLLYIAHYIRNESVEWMQTSTLQNGASGQG